MPGASHLPYACPNVDPSLKCTLPIVYRFSLLIHVAGKLYFCNPTIDDREAECARLQRETGAAFVHPYNDARVMAGDIMEEGGLGDDFYFCIGIHAPIFSGPDQQLVKADDA